MNSNFVSTHTMRKTYSYQTRKFIIQSSRGSNYIFILYDYDSNSILSIPIKNRQAKSIADAWKLCYIRLKNNSHTPDLHILDNECSDLLKSSFHKYNIYFQWVTPHSNRRNVSKRAIQTWKTHFLFGLATCGGGRYSLEIDVVFMEGWFQEVWAFVVDYVQIRGVAVLFDTDVSKFPWVSNGFRLSILDGYGQYGVWVVVVYYEDVVISLLLLDDKFSFLVWVSFAHCVGGDEVGVHGVC